MGTKYYPGSAYNFGANPAPGAALSTKSLSVVSATNIGSSGTGGFLSFLNLTSTIGAAASSGAGSLLPVNTICAGPYTQYVYGPMVAQRLILSAQLRYDQFNAGTAAVWGTINSPALPSLPAATLADLPIKIGIYGYVYRPSTAAVIGEVIAGPGSLVAYDESNYVPNPNCARWTRWAAPIGAGIDVIAGDVLIFEMWGKVTALTSGLSPLAGLGHKGNVEFTEAVVRDWRVAPIQPWHPALSLELTNLAYPSGSVYTSGTPVSAVAATTIPAGGEVSTIEADGTQLAHTFQALTSGSSPTVRAIGKFHQFTLSNEPGYFIDEARQYLDISYGGTNYTLTIPTGRYDNIVDLLDAVYTQAGAQSLVLTHNQVNTSTRPATVVITGGAVFTFLWTTGTNASSTALLCAMLGFSPETAELAAGLTQTGTETVYYRQASDIEIATGVVSYTDIKRRP